MYAGPPVVDGRNFEQLLAELKNRIPRHTPEWTGFENESDVGVTILQLFAFLAESVIFSAGEMPERARRRFLQLLDVKPRPAAAARGVVVIRPESAGLTTRTLPGSVQVQAGEVRFVTDDPITVLPLDARVYMKRLIDPASDEYAQYLEQYEAVLAAIEAQGDGSVPANSEPAFYETVELAEPLPGAALPRFSVGTATPDGAVYIALLAPPGVEDLDSLRTVIAGKTLNVGVYRSPQDVPVAPMMPRRPVMAGRASAPAVLFELATPQGSGVAYRPLASGPLSDDGPELQVFSVELPEVAALAAPVPREPLDDGTQQRPPALEDDKIRARVVCWIRVRIASAAGGAAVSVPLAWVGINAARVRQAIGVTRELVGVASGEPDQRYALANAPVLPETVTVEVEDQFTPGRWSTWLATDLLRAAGPNDTVFELDPASGALGFGTSFNGVAPPRGSRIRASYRYGGGTRGNVTVSAISASSDSRLAGTKVRNPVPTWGGDSGQSEEDAERSIPLVLRHRDRLVTADDAKAIVGSLGVVGRVDVLAAYRPGEAQEAPGAITILAVPKDDAGQPRWPRADRSFLRMICEHLEPRRLVTTEVHVRGPEYVPITVSVGLHVQGGAFRDAVIDDVRARLGEFLSSLPPGGPMEEGWPLGRRVHINELDAVVARVAGVEYVVGIHLLVNGQRVAEWTPQHLQLPRVAAIDVREGEPGEPAPAPAPGNAIPIPVVRTRC